MWNPSVDFLDYRPHCSLWVVSPQDAFCTFKFPAQRRFRQTPHGRQPGTPAAPPFHFSLTFLTRIYKCQTLVSGQRSSLLLVEHSVDHHHLSRGIDPLKTRQSGHFRCLLTKYTHPTASLKLTKQPDIKIWCLRSTHVPFSSIYPCHVKMHFLKL